MKNTELRDNNSSESQVTQDNQDKKKKVDLLDIALALAFAAPAIGDFFDGLDKVLYHFDNIKIQNGDTEVEINTVHSKKNTTEIVAAVECSQEPVCVDGE